jgi:hypothetical protein
LARREHFRASGFRPQAHGRREHKIGSVWFEQVDRTYIRLKPAGDQTNDVHQRLVRLPALGCKRGHFL